MTAWSIIVSAPENVRLSWRAARLHEPSAHAARRPLGQSTPVVRCCSPGPPRGPRDRSRPSALAPSPALKPRCSPGNRRRTGRVRRSGRGRTARRGRNLRGPRTADPARPNWTRSGWTSERTSRNGNDGILRRDRKGQRGPPRRHRRDALVARLELRHPPGCSRFSRCARRPPQRARRLDFTPGPFVSILVWPPVVCRTWSGAHGELPKRPKGSDCKSAGIAFGGSNPSLATRRSPGSRRGFRRLRGSHVGGRG